MSEKPAYVVSTVDDIKKQPHLDVASMAILVEFYNKWKKDEDAEVKRFRSKEDAVDACKPLLRWAQKVWRAAEKGAEPPVRSKPPREPVSPDEVRQRIAAATANSWKDPEVAAARAERAAVEANGQYFPSVATAFRALGLPFAKHVKFRAELKAEGSKEFEGVLFKVVPLQKAEPPAPKANAEAEA